MNGVLVVDKPAGMTSHDVVRRIRHVTGQRDVGHLGTLDPMATGVLPLVLGKFTRLAQFYDKAEKTYEGVILLGMATDTYDAEGQVVGEPISVRVTREQVEAAMVNFRGELEQMPPSFSAKKIGGVPAYKLARKQKEVELSSVTVTVKRFEVKEFNATVPASTWSKPAGRELGRLNFASLSFIAEVSSGTYIRSLAHDLGRALGTGAFLQTLRRTRSGDFTLEGTQTLEVLDTKRGSDELTDCLVPARKLLPHMPCVTATEDQMAKIRHGNAVNLPEFSQSELVKVFQGQGELVAVAKRIAGTLFQPKIVLCG